MLSDVEICYKSGSVQYIDSREVAEMVGKNHRDLMRDIRRYCKQMEDINNNSESRCKIAFSDFFAETSYFDAQGQERPCYFITRKGCEFIAHKLTGVKGMKFINKKAPAFLQTLFKWLLFLVVVCFDYNI